MRDVIPECWRRGQADESVATAVQALGNSGLKLNPPEEASAAVLPVRSRLGPDRRIRNARIRVKIGRTSTIHTVPWNSVPFGEFLWILRSEIHKNPPNGTVGNSSRDPYPAVPGRTGTIHVRNDRRRRRNARGCGLYIYSSGTRPSSSDDDY